jgi:Tol biopolymer transport system component
MPSWSPDDTKLVFNTTGRGKHKVTIIDLETGETEALGQGDHPDWRRF